MDMGSKKLAARVVTVQFTCQRRSYTDVQSSTSLIVAVISKFKIAVVMMMKLIHYGGHIDHKRYATRG